MPQIRAALDGVHFNFYFLFTVVVVVIISRFRVVTRLGVVVRCQKGAGTGLHDALLRPFQGKRPFVGASFEHLGEYASDPEEMASLQAFWHQLLSARSFGEALAPPAACVLRSSLVPRYQ